MSSTALFVWAKTENIFFFMDCEILKNSSKSELFINLDP